MVSVAPAASRPAANATLGAYHGFEKTVGARNAPICLSQHDPPTRTPDLAPGEVIVVRPAKPGSNVPRPYQKGRKRQYRQRKRGQFYPAVQAIKRSARQFPGDHPRGYLYESHHPVVPVPAPSALDLDQPGVRVHDSGLVEHYFHVDATHIPSPQRTPTNEDIRRKFKRARVPDSDGKYQSLLFYQSSYSNLLKLTSYHSSNIG